MCVCVFVCMIKSVYLKIDLPRESLSLAGTSL